MSRFPLSLRSSVRLWLLPVVLTSVVCSGCESDDDDDDGGDSSGAISQRVLLEVSVKVQPNVPLLNGEDEAVIHPAAAHSDGEEAEAGSEDVLAAIANGAAVETHSSSGSSGDSDSDDE